MTMIKKKLKNKKINLNKKTLKINSKKQIKFLKKILKKEKYLIMNNNK